MLLTCLLFKSWFLSLIHCKSCNPLECKFHMDSDFCPLFTALSPVLNSDKPARVHAFIKRLLSWCIRHCECASGTSLQYCPTVAVSVRFRNLHMQMPLAHWSSLFTCTKIWKVSRVLHSLCYFSLGLSIGKWKPNSLAPRKDKPRSIIDVLELPV